MISRTTCPKCHTTHSRWIATINGSLQWLSFDHNSNPIGIESVSKYNLICPNLECDYVISGSSREEMKRWARTNTLEVLITC